MQKIENYSKIVHIECGVNRRMSHNLQTDDKAAEKVNTVKFADNGSCTGGYDGMYGGGYSSSNIAHEIQNCHTMGQEMLEIAEKDGMELYQKEGYFHFGAGKTVEQGNVSVQIPTSFVCNENKEDDVLKFSYKKNNDEDKTPFEISLKHKALEKKQLVCEFFKETEERSVHCGMEYKEMVVDGNPALFTQKKIQKKEDSLSRANLSVLSEGGNEVYDLEIAFKSNLENSQSIADRVCRNFKIKSKAPETKAIETEEVDNKNLNNKKSSVNFNPCIYSVKDFNNKVEKKDFSIILPNDFYYEENIFSQKLIAVKKGCAIGGYDLSPIEIWIEKFTFLKQQLICDFFRSQVETALDQGAKYREMVVSGRPALMTMENKKALPQTVKITVLGIGGKSIYNIKIVFNKEFDNRDVIISNIYSGFKIVE